MDSSQQLNGPTLKTISNQYATEPIEVSVLQVHLYKEIPMGLTRLIGTSMQDRQEKQLKNQQPTRREPRRQKRKSKLKERRKSKALKKLQKLSVKVTPMELTPTSEMTSLDQKSPRRSQKPKRTPLNEPRILLKKKRT